jgi:hypothetical protein
VQIRNLRAAIIERHNETETINGPNAKMRSASSWPSKLLKNIQYREGGDKPIMRLSPMANTAARRVSGASWCAKPKRRKGTIDTNGRIAEDFLMR